MASKPQTPELGTNAPSPRLRQSSRAAVAIPPKTRRQDSPSLRREYNSHNKPSNSRAAPRRPPLVDETMTESSSNGSRKGRQSITHLLNYTVSSQSDRIQAQRRGHAQRTIANRTWGLGSGYHAADKARYIHANFRFVVDPSGDYEAQAADADVHLDWSKVWQILSPTQWQGTNCPICLSVPVSPRMAKCGHIFCLPCLIRYMHSDDDSSTSSHPDKRPRWKKCPICFDSLYISETRPLRWRLGQEPILPQAGQDIVLRLMARSISCTLALPRDSLADHMDAIPWHYAADIMEHARIIKGDHAYMLAHYEREILELEEQEKHDELMFGEETVWTRKAIASIQDAMSRLNDPHDHVPSSLPRRTGRTPAVGSTGPTASSKASRASVITNYERSLSPKALLDTPNPIETPPEIAPAKVRRRLDSSNQKFYYYETGSQYYLAPLDIRILKTAFGDYRNFPTTVLPRVEQVSTGHIVDDDLRRRVKYLNHLPQGAEVAFLECDWTDIVPSEILLNFEGEIERRRRRNEAKDVREEKERVRAERAMEDERWTGARRARPVLADQRAAAIDLAQSLDSDSYSPIWPEPNRPQTESFGALASPSSSPNTARTVWGTRMPAPTSPAPAPVPTADEDDGWLEGWESSLLAADEDLASQLEAAALQEDVESTETSGTRTSSKKKRAKKITLMSTTARRGQ